MSGPDTRDAARPKRAVAIGGANAFAGGRGALADAVLAVAKARGIAVRRDADLAEALSALDPATATSDTATALTAALLDGLYRLNAQAKEKEDADSERG